MGNHFTVEMVTRCHEPHSNVVQRVPIDVRKSCPDNRCLTELAVMVALKSRHEVLPFDRIRSLRQSNADQEN